jgi:hypothetical protein
VVLVLVVLIVAAPAWLLADWLKNFTLHPTDFIYRSPGSAPLFPAILP